MGFNEKVVDLFMQCVTNVRYRICHSGKEFGNIIPERGLRQGDPLSSFLFLICTEGFSALMSKFEAQGFLGGIKVARGAPSISHMIFVDDSDIFCKASISETRRVVDLLNMFEKASGQKINRHKSSVFFSRNVKMECKNEILEALNFPEADETTHYLGLPNFIGRRKSALLGYLKERVKDRVQAWDGKILTKAGKEILLKTVAQAIPNYAMSVFLLPLDMCKEMEKLMCKFWWRTNTKKNRSIHWMSWDRMCMPKSEGGLGFRHLHDFNIALLGKQAWRLVTKAESLVAKVYKARYYPQNSFLTATIGSNPSFVWRSILEAQTVVKGGIACRVGSGASISVLNDP